MKKRIRIIGSIGVFIISLFMLSSKEFVPMEVEVKASAEFLDADRFQLFYNFKDDVSFVESRSINYQVKGRKGLQDIVFKIPLQNKTLHNIRLDISSANYNQRPITLNSVTLNNGKTEIIYNDILTHFEMNTYLTFEKGKFNTTVLNDKYDPSLTLKVESGTLESLALKEKRFSIIEVLCFSIIVSMLFWVFSRLLMKDKKVFSMTIFNGLFIILLFLPLVLSIFNIKDTSKKLDNRVAIEAPEFELSKSYFKNFEKYYNDNFPFRNTLIKQNTAIRTNLFKVSPAPQKVRFGNDKFLFSNMKEAHTSYSNTNLLSDKELNAAVNAFVSRKEDLNKRNKEYYLGYFPNKHSIYNEYLPNSMQAQIKGATGLADQIKEALSKKGLNFFDPSETLLKEKNANLLYHKLDTHWNDYGAFYGYQAFFKDNKRLNIQPYNISEFKIAYMERSWGDLTKLIGTDSISGYTETRPLFKFKDQSRGYKMVDVKGFPAGTIRTENANCGNNKKVLFFGDSFSVYSVQFFSLHFNEVIYVRDTYNEELINTIDPDVVIELMVERFIYKHY